MSSSFTYRANTTRTIACTSILISGQQVHRSLAHTLTSSRNTVVTNLLVFTMVHSLLWLAHASTQKNLQMGMPKRKPSAGTNTPGQFEYPYNPSILGLGLDGLPVTDSPCPFEHPATRTGRQLQRLALRIQVPYLSMVAIWGPLRTQQYPCASQAQRIIQQPQSPALI